MAVSPDRLVRRIQRQLQSSGSIDPESRQYSREIAELKARLLRLHALGKRFSHVRLSPDVTRGGVTASRVRVRGECVATEA